MNPVLIPWVIALGLITWRDRTDPNHAIRGLPLPADYLASFAIYGILALPSGDWRKPAAALAWGYTIALALRPDLITPGTKVKPVTVTGNPGTAPANTPGIRNSTTPKAG